MHGGRGRRWRTARNAQLRDPETKFKTRFKYRILQSTMRIRVQCAPEFHNDIWQKKLLFFKNNFTRINHCKFIHHKRHLKTLSQILYMIIPNTNEAIPRQ